MHLQLFFTLFRIRLSISKLNHFSSNDTAINAYDSSSQSSKYHYNYHNILCNCWFGQTNNYVDYYLIINIKSNHVFCYLTSNNNLKAIQNASSVCRFEIDFFLLRIGGSSPYYNPPFDNPE